MTNIVFVDSEEQVLASRLQCKSESQAIPPTLPANSDGSFTIPEDLQIERLVATPFSKHWSVSMPQPTESAKFECSEIAPETLNWWRELMVGSGPIDCDGIKVGVIDLGFSKCAEQRQIPENDQSGFPETYFTHGPLVCSIISEEYISNKQGMCKNLILDRYEANSIDPPYVNIDPKELQENFDPDHIAEGIDYLANVAGVDIINLSGGSYSEIDNHVLVEAVENAYEAGTIIVCATGNDPKFPVAQPARFPNVIGVGGIGISGIAPKNSNAGFMQRQVAPAPRLNGITSCGNHAFKDMYTSFGNGLDIVAPSIGLPLTLSDKVIIDEKGTSFSCPMVTGLLAGILSRSLEFKQASGKKRADLAREILFSLCFDLSMDETVQGAGLPCLRQKT